MDKAKFLEAVDIFGQEVVNEVRAVVQLSDPDGAQVLFEDESMYDHAECVEFLYFE